MDISVYTPVYNGAKFIKRCIDSVLSQEFSGKFEYIIIDDGSTDNTIELIEEYNDPRIHLYKCEHKGLVDTCNFGLQQCKGKYIARIDADDELLPNSLQIRYDFLEKNQDYGFVCGDAYVVSDDMIKQRYGSGFELTYNRLFQHMCVTHSCLMHKASLNFSYKKQYDGAEDYYMLLDATYRGIKGRSLENVICKYYIHPDQICSKFASKNNLLAMIVQMHFFIKEQRDKRLL